jgi:hypothetical protein
LSQICLGFHRTRTNEMKKIFILNASPVISRAYESFQI